VAMFGESIETTLEHRPAEELDDDELDDELTIAAVAIGRLRFDRYTELLREAERRSMVPAQRAADPP